MNDEEMDEVFDDIDEDLVGKFFEKNREAIQEIFKRDEIWRKIQDKINVWGIDKKEFHTYGSQAQSKEAQIEKINSFLDKNKDLFAEKEFSDDQKVVMMSMMKDGCSRNQLKLVAYPEMHPVTMLKVSALMEQGMPLEKLEIIASPNYGPEQVDAVAASIDGLTNEQLNGMLGLKDAKEMDIYANLCKAGYTPDDIKRMDSHSKEQISFQTAYLKNPDYLPGGRKIIEVETDGKKAYMSDQAYKEKLLYGMPPIMYSEKNRIWGIPKEDFKTYGSQMQSKEVQMEKAQEFLNKNKDLFRGKDFSNEQKLMLMSAMKDGASREQLKLVANPDMSENTMGAIISRAEAGFSTEELALLSNPTYSPEQVELLANTMDYLNEEELNGILNLNTKEEMEEYVALYQVGYQPEEISRMDQDSRERIATRSFYSEDKEGYYPDGDEVIAIKGEDGEKTYMSRDLYEKSVLEGTPASLYQKSGKEELSKDDYER